MPVSPDPLNTFIGAGLVKWKAVGDIAYRDLGEASMFALGGTVQRKDFFSKRHGKRRKVRSVVTEESMTCTVKMEEITPDNLALFFLGSLAAPVDPATYSTIQLMDLGEVNGAFRFIGTTDIGEKVQVDLPSVNVAPNGNFDFLADDWGGLELVAEVVADPATGSFGNIKAPITVEVTA